MLRREENIWSDQSPLKMFIENLFLPMKVYELMWGEFNCCLWEWKGQVHAEEVFLLNFCSKFSAVLSPFDSQVVFSVDLTVVLLLLCQGTTLLMMGSAGEIPQAPVQKTMFVEDMTDSQLASAVSDQHCVIRNMITELSTCRFIWFWKACAYRKGHEPWEQGEGGREAKVYTHTFVFALVTEVEEEADL